MPRPKLNGAFRRDIKFEISIDKLLHEDLERIAESWNIPYATAAYWLLKGLIAEIRGEMLTLGSDSIGITLAKRLRDLSETQ